MIEGPPQPKQKPTVGLSPTPDSVPTADVTTIRPESAQAQVRVMYYSTSSITKAESLSHDISALIIYRLVI